jgi:high affinity Mn2+ porin
VLKKLLFGAVVVCAMSCGGATAADGPVALPVKAPDRPSYYDWTGFYVGGHFGYAAGYSKWSGTEPGAATSSLVGSRASGLVSITGSVQTP